MERVIVLIDPTEMPDYASQMSRAFERVWGIRTVVLYRRGTSRPLIAEAETMLDRRAVAGRFWIDSGNLEQAARALRNRFRVIAVAPHFESVVVEAGELAELLDLDWVPLEVLKRFRDKYSLKEHLRSSPDGPRINASCRVTTVAEVRDFIADHELSRIVIKPNDGMGNSRIVFFDHDTPDAPVADYLRQHAGTPLVAEEFLSGPEFCVNGQIDDDGVVHTLSVQHTVHGSSANGRDNLGASLRMIHRDTPQFTAAAQYASDVMIRSGLRRSPFHMEVRIDDRGPCLIEVAARLGGAGIPWDTALAHAGSVSLFEQAAKYYADLPGDLPGPNWDAYDRHTIWTVFGISTDACRVRKLTGVREVEALPEFAYWMVRPKLGQGVSPTIDVGTIPWQVTLKSQREDLTEVEERVRSLISWNPPASAPVRWAQGARAAGAWAARRARTVPALIGRPPHRLASGAGGR